MDSSPKNDHCNHLLTLMSFQIYEFFLLWYTAGEILKIVLVFPFQAV